MRRIVILSLLSVVVACNKSVAPREEKRQEVATAVVETVP